MKTNISQTASALALLSALALAVVGCGSEDGSRPDRDAGDDGGGGTGGTGTAGTQAQDAGSDGEIVCLDGTVGCPCDNGSCSEGQCVSGWCIDCLRGEDGCLCRSNGTCDQGLVCTDGVCELCPPGESGCACLEGDACTGGLVCQAGVCVQEQCVDGSLGCPCRPWNEPPRCDGDAYCGDNDLCVACSNDVAGCACDEGACSGGLFCVEDLCQEILDCEGLKDAGLCGEHQLCDAGPVCREGECEPSYLWDEDLVDCILDAVCSPPDSHRSIADQCASELRVCVEREGIPDICGDCVEGAVESDGVCLYEIDCNGEVCQDDEYCDRLDVGGVPLCKALPCGEGQVRNSSGSCVTCSRSCEVEGSTGRPWPFQDNEGNCICETQPGYFFPKGGSGNPQKCDADRDGWVRDDVRDPVFQSQGGDAALAQNMRCDVRSIDRVALRDEYGIEVQLWSCAQGLVKQQGTDPPPADACSDAEDHLIRLLESKRNDTPGDPEQSTTAPAYGERRLRANELNALTKACVDTLGDYNDNGDEDVDEVQPRPADTGALSEEQRLRSFAHFIELYTARYQPPSGVELYGRLLVAERSRCNTDTFVLGYGSGAAYDQSVASTYWRSCYRNRDPGFDADDTGEAGNDFAQWSCDSRTGSCAAVPPAHPDRDAEGYDASTDELLRDHGLCELGGVPPADGVWRGMHHHSQFKCMRISDADGLSASPPTLTFNYCWAESCEGEGIECVLSRSNGELETRDPVIACTADSGAADDYEVGWMAVRYQPYGHMVDPDHDGTLTLAEGTDPDYNGGCVNEDAEWPDLCPYPEFGVCSSAPTGAFGRYHCYGWDSMFLWAPDDATTDNYTRNTLFFADEDSGTDEINMSVWAPAPDDSPGAACI